MTWTIIHGGKVVMPTGTQQVDILIENEKIAGIGKARHFPRTDNRIDAQGMIVLPGLVDVHVHFLDKFMGATSQHDFFTGTRAAAYGGVTTIIDFANQNKGGSLTEAIQRRRAEASGHVVIDYGLHAEIRDPSPTAIREVRSIIKAGVPSFKIYTTYGAITDDGAMAALFEQTSRYGGLVMVHAENNAIAQRLKQEFLNKGKTSAIYHALSKPNIVEAETINRVVYLGRALHASFYIVHISTHEGNEIMGACRKDGFQAFAETCTHYLCLTDSMYKKKDGINYIISPPLRKKEDVESLWKGLFSGSISVVSTDDSSFSGESKLIGKDSFDKVPNGMAGVELRLPILYSEGVRKRGMTLERLAELTSTNPARLFGLYPQKGVIQVGTDADLVILNPSKEVTLGMKTTHMLTDFCSLEGWRVTGYPVMTIFRGSVIVDNGTFLGREGDGRFLRRNIDFKKIKDLR